ncbi:MAG: 1-aminocyclopropane-1-carboxylate deaminase/D-cysteine desulfhydrase [Acidiferrobacterales bacterium]
MRVKTRAKQPPRVSLANTPTPLQLLKRLSNEINGPRIWVKRDDLTGSGLSGNKVRKLEFSVGEALAQGCDTLITCGGLQSNHCRATALVGARLGLKVHLFLRGLPQGVADGNLFLDQLAGAAFSFFPPEEYYARHNEIVAELVDDYANEGHKAFVIPTGASDEIGVWGYVAACEEIKRDSERLGFTLDCIVSANGSGGTLAGLIAGNALHELGAVVYGINVDDDNAQFFDVKIRRDLRRWKERYGQALDVEGLPINIVDGYLGPGYGKTYPAMLDTIRRCARTEGIILDPVYSGKAFHGMLAEIERGRFADASDIVFIHTGGIFGLFAQRNEFEFANTNVN